MVSKRVMGFEPSVNGFHFPNLFADAPLRTIHIPPFGDIPIGHATAGMCGGMVFAALDIFGKGLKPRPDVVAPEPGTPLFSYLVNRLFDSFNGVMGVYKYLEWMRFPDEAHFFGVLKTISWHSVNDEWPAIQSDLDNGVACPLGLIKVESLNPFDLGRNHQALAYGYDLDEISGDLQICVYDPNCPNDDTVTLAVNVANPDNPSRIVYSADSNGRGFFRTKYSPADPSAALLTA
jgi:hypothetical protein